MATPGRLTPATSNKQMPIGNTVPGVVDLSLEPQVDVPVLRVVFDRQPLARHGLHVREVDSALQAAIQGLHVSTILEGQNAFNLVARRYRCAPWLGSSRTPAQTPSAANRWSGKSSCRPMSPAAM